MDATVSHTHTPLHEVPHSLSLTGLMDDQPTHKPAGGSHVGEPNLQHVPHPSHSQQSDLGRDGEDDFLKYLDNFQNEVKNFQCTTPTPILVPVPPTGEM